MVKEHASPGQSSASSGVMGNSRSERGKISSNTEENRNGRSICGSKSKLKAQGCRQMTCSETDCGRTGGAKGVEKGERRPWDISADCVSFWYELAVAWKMHRSLRCFEGQVLAGMA